MKTKNIFLTLALALSTTFAFAQSIAGSAHDFSGATWNNTNSGEICNACHTPHNATAASAPLWDRVVISGAYTAYSSTTFDAIKDAAGPSGTGGAYTAAPSGVSLLCLTCHDGSTLLDNGGNDLTTTMTTLNTAAVRSGGTNEHPISINYTSELVGLDGGLEDLATANPRLSASGTVECSSCHDVHGTFNNTKGEGLLAATNVGSAVCLTCHKK